MLNFGVKHGVISINRAIPFSHYCTFFLNSFTWFKLNRFKQGLEINEIKASNETSSAKSNAIISAAKAIEKVSEAFLAKYRRVDKDNKVAKAVSSIK